MVSILVKLNKTLPPERLQTILQSTAADIGYEYETRLIPIGKHYELNGSVQRIPDRVKTRVEVVRKMSALFLKGQIISLPHRPLTVEFYNDEPGTLRISYGLFRRGITERYLDTVAKAL